MATFKDFTSWHVNPTVLVDTDAVDQMGVAPYSQQVLHSLPELKKWCIGVDKHSDEVPRGELFVYLLYPGQMYRVSAEAVLGEDKVVRLMFKDER